MRRLVLLHTYGPLKGLSQIVGIYPGEQPILASIADGDGAADLAKVEARYVLYRSVPSTAGGAAPQGPSRPTGPQTIGAPGASSSVPGGI